MYRYYYYAPSRAIIWYKSRWNNTRDARRLASGGGILQPRRSPNRQTSTRANFLIESATVNTASVKGWRKKGRDNVPYILSIICFGYINAAGKLSITHPQRNRTVRILYL